MIDLGILRCLCSTCASFLALLMDQLMRLSLERLSLYIFCSGDIAQLRRGVLREGMLYRRMMFSTTNPPVPLPGPPIVIVPLIVV